MSTQSHPAKSKGQIAAEKLWDEPRTLQFQHRDTFIPLVAQIIDSVIGSVDSASLPAADTCRKCGANLGWLEPGLCDTCRPQPVQGLEQIAREARDAVRTYFNKPWWAEPTADKVYQHILRACQAAALQSNDPFDKDR